MDEREQAKEKELISDEDLWQRLMGKPEVRSRIEDARTRARAGRDRVIADNARRADELRRGRT